MNDLWRQLEAWLIGEPLSAQPGGLETSIQPTWDLPPWLVLTVLLASARRAAGGLLAGKSQCRRGRGRCCSPACGWRWWAWSLLMLYGWTVQRHRTDLPDVVVVLDDSASMSLVDHYDDKSVAAEALRRIGGGEARQKRRGSIWPGPCSWKATANCSTQLGRALQPARSFWPAARPARSAAILTALVAAVRQLAADQPASRLGDAVREVLEAQRGRPTAAIILLHRRRHHRGQTAQPRPPRSPAARAVPLFLVGLGSDQPRRDLRLADLLVDDVVFVSDLVNFDVKLSAKGFTGKATVRLIPRGRRASDCAAGRAGGRARSQGRAAQTLRLSHRPDKQGEFEYVVEVVPRDGEAERREQPARPQDHRPRGGDPRAPGAGPAELRIPHAQADAPARAEPRSAGGGQDPRLSHGAAGGGPGIRRYRQDGRAALPRQPRRAVRLRRADFRRREPGAAQPVDHAEHL